jgi:hypothetical protein
VLHKTAGASWSSTSGWTERRDDKSTTFSDCKDGGIVFGGIPGKRIAFDVHEVTFESHGTRLAGRLVMPGGTGKVPVVVLLHGAEHVSALADYALQRTLPANGIGAFVFDKRGTGASGGEYSQDFSLLADDAVVATGEARRLAGARLARIGYQAGSQGGWVAPIAASRTPVDFVIVCFGLAVNIIDEDQQAVDIQLRERGYSPEEIAHAKEVASAAETVFASGFTRGFKEFDALRAKYKNARWYKHLEGDYTYFLLPYSEAQLREMAPKYKWGTPFFYDPMPTLRAAKVPELWIIGGEDYQAPSTVTRRLLNGLVESGHPFTVAYYPHAEHGMTRFETTADGSRLSTRYEEGYFRMMRDYAINGRLQGPYGDAELNGAAAAKQP